jgi:hypothetical protein
MVPQENESSLPFQEKVEECVSFVCGFEASLLRFSFQAHNLQAMWNWEYFVASKNVSLLICKMDTSG